MNAGTERAKELFLAYGGSRFFMDREGDGPEYDSFHVPKETEEAWAKEFILSFLGSDKRGKEALRAYSTAEQLLQVYNRDGLRERLLFFPLRAAHLDDVTALFMLQTSFITAERAAKKKRLSRETAEAYVKELDAFAVRIRDRAEKGTLSRTDDYVMREFSDPEYVSFYLDDLRKKWLCLEM